MSNKRGELLDKEYALGIAAGYKAGLRGDDSILDAAQNRVASGKPAPVMSNTTGDKARKIYHCDCPGEDVCVLCNHTLAVHHLDRLQAELERERIRLAACGVVAMSNTPESAEKSRQMQGMYWSASCEDVARAVDKQMQLAAELAERDNRIKNMQDDFDFIRDRDYKTSEDLQKANERIAELEKKADMLTILDHYAESAKASAVSVPVDVYNEVSAWIKTVANGIDKFNHPFIDEFLSAVGEK